jgi:hypothetical protein
MLSSLIQVTTQVPKIVCILQLTYIIEQGGPSPVYTSCSIIIFVFVQPTMSLKEALQGMSIDTKTRRFSTSKPPADQGMSTSRSRSFLARSI